MRVFTSLVGLILGGVLSPSHGFGRNQTGTILVFSEWLENDPTSILSPGSSSHAHHPSPKLGQTLQNP